MWSTCGSEAEGWRAESIDWQEEEPIRERISSDRLIKPADRYQVSSSQQPVDESNFDLFKSPKTSSVSRLSRFPTALWETFVWKSETDVQKHIKLTTYHSSWVQSGMWIRLNPDQLSPLTFCPSAEDTTTTCRVTLKIGRTFILKAEECIVNVCWRSWNWLVS